MVILVFELWKGKLKIKDMDLWQLMDGLICWAFVYYLAMHQYYAGRDRYSGYLEHDK